jgi:hypothetical protein
MLSASLLSRIRAPIYLSTALGLLGEIFLFAFFIVVYFLRVGKSNSPERLRRDRHLNDVETFPRAQASSLCASSEPAARRQPIRSVIC